MCTNKNCYHFALRKNTTSSDWTVIFEFSYSFTEDKSSVYPYPFKFAQNAPKDTVSNPYFNHSYKQVHLPATTHLTSPLSRTAIHHWLSHHKNETNVEANLSKKLNHWAKQWNIHWWAKSWKREVIEQYNKSISFRCARQSQQSTSKYQNYTGLLQIIELSSHFVGYNLVLLG